MNYVMNSLGSDYDNTLREVNGIYDKVYHTWHWWFSVLVSASNL